MKRELNIEKIIDDNYTHLCLTAYGLVRSIEVAKDLVQEIFITFWEKNPKLSTQEEVRGYLLTMTRNRSLNWLRDTKRQGKRRARMEVENPQIMQDYQESEILSRIVEEEITSMLYSSICQLPTQSEKIIRLVLQDYDNHEIAKKLEISVNTVKTLKYGAIKKLRSILMEKEKKK